MGDDGLTLAQPGSGQVEWRLLSGGGGRKSVGSSRALARLVAAQTVPHPTGPVHDDPAMFVGGPVLRGGRRVAAHTAPAGMSDGALRLPAGGPRRRVVDRVARGRGEDVAEGLVRGVEAVDVVEHDGGAHGVVGGLERMSHHSLTSTSSPSCMGCPVTV